MHGLDLHDRYGEGEPAKKPEPVTAKPADTEKSEVDAGSATDQLHPTREKCGPLGSPPISSHFTGL